MSKYIQEWLAKRKIVRITDQETNYTLNLCYVMNDSFGWPYVTFDSGCSGPKLFITGRNIQEYDADIRNHIINPSYQYVEVGAGLGEFTPRLMETFGDEINNRPIIIDPANYDALNGLLDFALTLNLGDGMRDMLNSFNRRCKLIKNPQLVTLINLTLEEALETHFEILGIADVVVDNMGASHYNYTNYNSALQLEKKLLKPTGLLFSKE